jgi:hypothetical protein
MAGECTRHIFKMTDVQRKPLLPLVSTYVALYGLFHQQTSNQKTFQCRGLIDNLATWTREDYHITETKSERFGPLADSVSPWP